MPFAWAPKTLVEDPSVSWKAKGLFTYLNSRPDGWQIRRTDLLKRATDGKHALQTALEELQGAGVLEITRERDAEGQFLGTRWRICPHPENQHVDPYPDFPYPDNPAPDNQGVYQKEGYQQEGVASVGSSLRSSPTAASSDVEKPREEKNSGDSEDARDPPPNPWGDTIEAAQRHVWLGPDPPGDRTRGQEVSVARQLEKRWKLDRADLPDLLAAFARLRDRGEFRGWIDPEEPAAFLALNLRPGDHDGMPVVVRCMHEARKGDTPERSGDGSLTRAGEVASVGPGGG